MWSTIGVVAVLAALASASHVAPPPAPFNYDCKLDQDIFDPSKADEVPWFDIDLDAEPKERFKHVVRPFKDQINVVFGVVGEMLSLVPGIPVWDIISELMEQAFNEGYIMQPYHDEVQGIADELGCDLGHLAFMNIFYEFSRFCTSIIADDPNKVDIWHVRNLDFGQLFIWEIDQHSWALTDSLKNVTVNLRFIKNGTVQFMGTTLAGHVGLLTAMKPYKFSLSMNAKVEPDYGELSAWMAGERPNIEFAMYFDRHIFETCDTYEQARQKIAEVQLLSGAYFILGGGQPGQGAIIVRNITDVQWEVPLYSQEFNTSWYVLQTNYDPGQLPLYVDDRQDGGNQCMAKMGPAGVSLANLYKVLSSKTTLNKTTVHTVLMSVTQGIYMTFLQHCPDPCWFC